jgi:hypothetical protein
MFNLYYLSDQSDEIDGTKYLVGSFDTLAESLNRATTDGTAHYSVEQTQDGGSTYCIVYII